ncbi:MAG: HpcH/HpaI aldolase [Mesorhizobium sp.]|uniref:HpcH/HpaI aldolase family protein n=1 Tax=Mesorhizobium sp. TaxID=1871066 RepID=UPI000FE6FDA2|nr:aldolase/citrate lyase family protein [Mesorhizobium sp.]RWI08680.1 MAG: HpcH/HpaI aldolase [Mesorhizobium sp.]RWM85689.1 MAG: HpcH/HpaI aldolase [Mesorhizobium sp.]TIO14281.1 MAG: HpcH/HpaI aldolase [Mesorhizobium sp.]TIP92844.1 MAG: HpcH/HpaI aldolase [Mesorhizobium sp.]TIQ20353.1 MAG: HpcH/HpaI aldolase [Mesorhizobium sp.]
MNRVRQLWQEGKPVVAGWLQLPGALHAEALARCDYDAIVVDLQHSPIDFGMAVSMMSAIELGGAEPFVRVAANNGSEIGKLLDNGAYGIISPMINDAGDAQHLGRAVSYPPRGDRSFGPRRPNLRFGANYHAHASETLVTLAMIETEAAISNLDAILSVEGIDGVFVGPTDLALSLGCSPRVDSTEGPVVEAIQHIRRKSAEASKRCGIFCGSAAFARQKIEEGFAFVTVAPDLAMLTEAARNIISRTR